MKNITNYRNSNLILHLIKSCENYNLSEKESIETINKILDKDISRRTYYNYKKKLYDKDIIQGLKGSIYDTQALKCLLLDLEETDNQLSLVADKLISEQLPNRKDIFHDAPKQKEELTKTNEITNSMISQFKDRVDKPVQIYNSIPKSASIREEFVKCGKENYNDCPHGPYYYAYWRDITAKKLKKRYIGVLDPRH